MEELLKRLKEGYDVSVGITARDRWGVFMTLDNVKIIDLGAWSQRTYEIQNGDNTAGIKITLDGETKGCFIPAKIAFSDFEIDVVYILE